MIIGIVNAFAEATFNLPIQDADGTEQQITVIIDTGYDGSLTLPPSLINALGLPFRSRGVAVLADGSEAQFNTYAATVIMEWLAAQHLGGCRRHRSTYRHVPALRPRHPHTSRGRRARHH